MPHRVKKPLSGLKEILSGSRLRKGVFGAVAAVLLVALLGVSAASASPNTPAQRRAAATEVVSQASPRLSGFHAGMVPVSGGSLHYVIGGSGPVLVLLHGWPETWWEWHGVMPTLAQDHTVIAFDLPGLGQSTIPSGGFDAATTADRIHQAVNALGFHQVGVLAHDLGVLVGYDYARDYPSEVTRLAVLDSTLNGFGLESAYTLSFHFLFNQQPSPTPENIINNTLAEQTYLNYMYSFAHNPAAIDRGVYYLAYADPANREAGYDYYRAFPQNAADNVAHATPKLTVPVLAMGGQYSFGPAVAASFGNVATDVHQVVAPGSGHYIPEEVPGFLSECADLFFSSSANPTPPSSDYAACVAS
jgi:pimeloyl-ACP methyl ester carboxylesterase